MTPEARIIIALKLVEAVRDRATRTGKYDGGAAPNLQSVIDVLCLPDGVMAQQLITMPDKFRSTPAEESNLRAYWSGTST